MTIYIYDATEFEKENYVLVDSFDGDTHAECEKWVSEKNYDDPDLFAVSYTKG